ncbi:MAG: hypothetical protein CR972_01795 [Candidatus Moraniibacteriota bacterium]|nr:MAG: hypothetical protein CR972_01795 [Candidatus Moranbacteria bacterium]
MKIVRSSTFDHITSVEQKISALQLHIIRNCGYTSSFMPVSISAAIDNSKCMVHARTKHRSTMVLSGPAKIIHKAAQKMFSCTGQEVTHMRQIDFVLAPHDVKFTAYYDEENFAKIMRFFHCDEKIITELLTGKKPVAD